MYILPAIDLYEKKAVRLYRGDYKEMTVYSENPVEVAMKFREAGAEFIHLVDLEGARDGGTPNFEIIKEIIAVSGLKAEVGGGIRDKFAVRKYIEAGASRVILGTAAVTDPVFLAEMISEYGEKIAAGIDIRDGYAAIKGWRETSSITAEEMFDRLQQAGVKTVICTDISKDGAMAGTNVSLYKSLSRKYSIDIIASGGISDIDSIRAVKELVMYGAIIGKAYYTGAVNLREAIEVVR